MSTDVLISFGGGAVYGVASVVTAQPLDTVKTLMQAKTGQRISLRELGIRGLYRGSLPILIGGSTFRSAQFGFNEAALKLLPPRADKRPFSYQVILAGLAGGIGRGIVEAPFEFYKVVKRMRKSWIFLTCLCLGSTAVEARELQALRGLSGRQRHNLSQCLLVWILCDQLGRCELFCSVTEQLFVCQGVWSTVACIFRSTNKQKRKGALCANLAWLAVWPVDVIKSRRQSGLYAGQSSWTMLKELIKTKKLFAGVLPGLARSTIANGSGMYFMTKFTEYMKSSRTAT